jgi:hypothetical protein
LTAIFKADAVLPAFIITGQTGIAIRAGTKIDLGGPMRVYLEQTPIAIPVPLVAGADYGIRIDAEGTPSAVLIEDPELLFDCVGGFHFAPGGNAAARTGGDDVPAINPCSIWDIGFRPSCEDPRGMAHVSGVPGSEGVAPFWADIYLLGKGHSTLGTSCFGETIADGDNPPDGFETLDFAAAKAVMASHGKGLMSFVEFTAAAYGVTEKSARGKDPKVSGIDAPRTSRVGLQQATGNLWTWGHDGDPDEPRASIFGGNWGYGSSAGSRYARVDFWPGYSDGWLGARGRSDHLQLA